jgi:CHAD domain-containing protein
LYRLRSAKLNAPDAIAKFTHQQTVTRASSAGHNKVRPAGVKDLLCRCIGDALRGLRAKGTISDASIHNARKELKRARANLRLLRGFIGEAVYGHENAALRDAARALSAVRDAKVVMNVLNELRERKLNSAQRALLSDLRSNLEKARLRARRELSQTGALKDTAESLERASARVQRWPVPRTAAPLHRGLRHVYRRARDALADVKAEGSPENLHEWRKQVKNLMHAMDALKTPKARRISKLIKQSDSVADALGDDHDLMVLQEKIQGLHSGSHNAKRALSRRIAQRRKELEWKALKEGRALFRSTPKAFVKRFRKCL